MAYASWSVVFGEQPSATKWNILGTNDAEFNSLIQRNGTGANILDSNGNELIKGTAVASAVNELTATNAITGANPSLSATGGDTNISLSLVPKGSGVVTIASGAATNFAGILGAAQATSNQTGITATTDITSLTSTVTIPAGGRRIKVSGYVSVASTVANDFALVSITDGSNNVVQQNQIQVPTSANVEIGVALWVYLTPSAGSATYKMRLQRTGGTGTISAIQSATNPGQIIIENA